LFGFAVWYSALLVSFSFWTGFSYFFKHPISA